MSCGNSRLKHFNALRGLEQSLMFLMLTEASPSSIPPHTRTTAGMASLENELFLELWFPCLSVW